jgi:hypothetical protein
VGGPLLEAISHQVGEHPRLVLGLGGAAAGGLQGAVLGGPEHRGSGAAAGAALGGLGGAALGSKVNLHREDKARAFETFRNAMGGAKTAQLDAFLDELEQIKNAGWFDTLKQVATAPIPGTPNLLPGAEALKKLKSGLGAGQGASKGFQAFQAARAAAGH